MGKRSTAVFRKRVIGILNKAKRYKRVRAAGVSASRMAAIASAGISQALLYGGSVTGFSDSQISEVRSAYHTAFVWKTPGRSITVDCELTKGARDPAYRAATDVIGMLVTAVWLNWIPRHVLVILLNGAAVEMGRGTIHWN